MGGGTSMGDFLPEKRRGAPFLCWMRSLSMPTMTTTGDSVVIRNFTEGVPDSFSITVTQTSTWSDQLATTMLWRRNNLTQKKGPSHPPICWSRKYPVPGRLNAEIPTDNGIDLPIILLEIKEEPIPWVVLLFRRAAPTDAISPYEDEVELFGREIKSYKVLRFAQNNWLLR